MIFLLVAKYEYYLLKMGFLKNFMRISNWWHYKAAPLMAFIYAKTFINEVTPYELLPSSVVFFIAVIGIASLGHFINDLADIKEDNMSGKENFAAKMTFTQKILSAVLLLFLSIAPWFYLKTNALIIILLLLQISLYIIYSFKPFRLKNRHFWGVLADAMYGHIVPALVVLAVFSYYGTHRNFFSLVNSFSTILIIWLLTKGMRNIILHQIDDRKKDKQVMVNTFVVKFGVVFSLNLINRFILPLELIAFVILVSLAGNTFPLFYIFLMAFLIFTIIKFSLWKIFVLPPRQMRFKFLFFLNDFYEDWLPIVMLIYLINSNHYFVFYLMAHLLFFPKTVVNFAKDIKLLITRK